MLGWRSRDVCWPDGHCRVAKRALQSDQEGACMVEHRCAGLCEVTEGPRACSLTLTLQFRRYRYNSFDISAVQIWRICRVYIISACIFPCIPGCFVQRAMLSVRLQVQHSGAAPCRSDRLEYLCECRRAKLGPPKERFECTTCIGGQ